MTDIETRGIPTPTELQDTTPRSSMSHAMVEITNRRYQADPFWGGPKGVNYGLLVGALPIQQPGLYPDQGSTYFVAQFHLPKGASLTLRGEFGHLRYMSFTVAAQLGDGQLGNGDFLRDDEIDPDPGSINPFRGDARDGADRKFTLQVVQGAPPPKRQRPPNTLYTSSNSEEAPIHLAIRNYIPDVGHDGTGNVGLRAEGGYGLPEVRLHLPGGIELAGETMCELLRVSKAAEARAYTTSAWLQLVRASADPINAPAQPTPAFQRFWNTNYSVTGSFVTDPLVRVQDYPADDSGGLANNPDTIYMMASFSLYFGRVVVIRGKMPSHPRTRHREATPLGHTQVRYWSITAGGSASSGVGWQSLYDEEVPVDEHGNYTIVMSWPEDRPANATREHGVAWIDFGGGEGHYIGARNWVNGVYIRYMNPSPDWRESPARIPAPTPAHPYPRDAEVMKAYYPRAIYMSKDDFEAMY